MNISFAEPERLKEIFDGENREEWQRTSHLILVPILTTKTNRAARCD
ncbi:hypothetical protein VR7878_03186 [Vibrio ruber DSM 16370]|uniref:Uncharacterized protein n=1 Tax=Vibrio ruber (strain DSM 16370 / JCM 11486 / BCRC 17186 / CECT 7878 / LMG 23124 / VR1) TaxID=1123498 RepID=A0A1R4LR24_VIBR1|nr:hypothetical protein [Vibrio ruber]SJN59040.1 hypothetical protein VR7878_03186 [Vibrio ruber DSM 16370]